MLKTILKTLALSATALTLLSACGASDSLNAAISAYDANLNAGSKSSGFRNAGSGTEEGDEEYLPAVLAQVDERFLPKQLGESANLIESIEQQLIADDAESAPYISTAVHPGTDTYIMDPPLEDVPEPHSSDLDPTPFNMVAARVASFSVVGEIDDGGTRGYYHFDRLESIDFDDDTHNITRSRTQDTFSLVKNEGADKNLIMIVNGVEYKVSQIAYSPDHANREVATRFYNDPIRTGVDVGANGNIKEIIRGTHATIQGDYIQYFTNTNADGNYLDSRTEDYTTGYATIGIQTPAPVVDAQTAVAIYNGTSYLYTHAVDGLDTVSKWINPRITMYVNFDDNTVSGSGNSRYFGGGIEFGLAPIVGNGFEGTFTLNSRARKWFNLTDNPTGQYSGNFFGPNADDLAGVMSFESKGAYDTGFIDAPARDSVDVIAIGGFRADRAE